MSDPTKVLYDRVIDRVVSKLREAIERDGLDVRVADEVRERWERNLRVAAVLNEAPPIQSVVYSAGGGQEHVLPMYAMPVDGSTTVHQRRPAISAESVLGAEQYSCAEPVCDGQPAARMANPALSRPGS
mmetsp:Transcript_51350/g.115305  ORF Transcript_51350/g.115305 Transcript_51350/m.115305 type:complete len:129 (-) Transcript_51350:437-823(-)